MASLDVITLDCRRLLCPLPVIRLQDQVAGLAPGTRVEAICTDPGSLRDIPAWCRINGHEVIESHSEDGEHTILVLVGSASE